ncbi:MAG: tRNA (adenosine(37)-N6)-threonylcarbamoyltransferase complex dimerization subunit type 1 TsaB [Myxococcota bacterium]|nr:tRNA (adenosine(37)-N6)-threonylcarbamoyltransferase complex dimerization subunit type 1 TsaB [Myxococcota bacterium]
MKVLGFDTATLTAGVAVVDDHVTLADARHPGGGRSADLLVSIDEVCRRAKVTPYELDAIAVGAGPGSFTGLRIGMATAKGIAFAARKPLWAVSSLAALAFDAEMHLANEQLLTHVDGLIVAVLDARRSEVFAGIYRHRALVAEERVFAPAELAAWVRSFAGDATVTYAGDAIDTYRDVLSPLAADWLPPRTPSGIAVAILASAGARVDILTSGTPTYIRPSEAEVMYPDGVPGALKKPCREP